MEVQGVSCTTCTKKQSMIMAYLYRKNRSPFWYIQYVDSDRKKHDKSTGFRADDPNDTVKASSVSCEPNRCLRCECLIFSRRESCSLPSHLFEERMAGFQLVFRLAAGNDAQSYRREIRQFESADCRWAGPSRCANRKSDAKTFLHILFYQIQGIHFEFRQPRKSAIRERLLE